MGFDLFKTKNTACNKKKRNNRENNKCCKENFGTAFAITHQAHNNEKHGCHRKNAVDAPNQITWVEAIDKHIKLLIDKRPAGCGTTAICVGSHHFTKFKAKNTKFAKIEVGIENRPI